MSGHQEPRIWAVDVMGAADDDGLGRVYVTARTRSAARYAAFLELDVFEYFEEYLPAVQGVRLAREGVEP